MNTSKHRVAQELSWKGQEKTVKICDLFLFSPKRNHGKPWSRGKEKEMKKVVEVGSFVKKKRN